MGRQRALVLAALAILSLGVAGCSFGPVAIGVPVSGSSSTRWSPEVRLVVTCTPTAGHIKIEVDSTAGANPDVVAYSVLIDGDESPPWLPLDGPVGFHFEHTDGAIKAQGCFSVRIAPGCTTPCAAWTASLQTFNYRISVVP